MALTIGFTGRMRTGKTTSANFLEDAIGLVSAQLPSCVPVRRLSFADEIKNFLTKYVGRSEPFRGNDQERNAPIPELWWKDFSDTFIHMVYEQYPEFIEASPHPTGRQLMQLFGSELFRDFFDPLTWVRITKNIAHQSVGIACIDDARYENECLPRSKGGIFDYLIKLNRPGIPESSHTSERSVDLINPSYLTYTFTNDGTLSDLQFKIQHWVEHEVVPEHPEIFNTERVGHESP